MVVNCPSSVFAKNSSVQSDQWYVFGCLALARMCRTSLQGESTGHADRTSVPASPGPSTSRLPGIHHQFSHKKVAPMLEPPSAKSSLRVSKGLRWSIRLLGSTYGVVVEPATRRQEGEYQ